MSSFATEDEAHYVVAVLNSAALNEAIKPFQSMGLMGERDIEKKVLDVPFPTYQSRDSRHLDLVRLSKQAQGLAREVVAGGGLPVSLARRRSVVRFHLKDILEEIDAIVRSLI
jgi:hypothetical protein